MQIAVSLFLKSHLIFLVHKIRWQQVLQRKISQVKVCARVCVCVCICMFVHTHAPWQKGGKCLPCYINWQGKYINQEMLEQCLGRIILKRQYEGKDRSQVS